jgi:putative acetyltransferase
MTKNRSEISYRPATDADWEAVLGIFNRARTHSLSWLPRIHTDDEDRWFVRHKMLVDDEVTLAIRDGQPVGFCALSVDMIDHLYIDPCAHRLGIGKHFVDRAKVVRPDGFTLYCFTQNENAAAFYCSQGLTVVEEGDGSGNEEGVPDLLFAWRPSVHSN